MANALQVKKTPCYDESGYEFYPVRNYDSHSDDWMWIPEEYEEVFSEKSPFVKPELNDKGEMIGFSYVEKPLISQELLIGVVTEIVENGVSTLSEESMPCISEFLKILHPVEVGETEEDSSVEDSSDVENSDSGETENVSEENL